jgi:hypothetical protein
MAELDELVHLVASQIGSNVNNSGEVGQRSFLAEHGYSEADITAYIDGGVADG